ncbi:MAG TPA: ABC transporter permease [Dongiaceae bacterium]
MSSAVPPGTPVFAEVATGRPVGAHVVGDQAGAIRASGTEGEPIPHLVSTTDFDPMTVEQMTPEQERFYMASQWRMMWWRFRRHRLAVVAGVLLLVFYATIFVSEFLSPYALHTRHVDFIFAPPQGVHLFDDTGHFVGPFVYGLDYHLDLENLERDYSSDRSKIEKLRFFCHGEPYKFWGLIPGDMHLVCPAEGGTAFFLGSDRLGRDMLSRIIYGARISLTIGLIGVSVSFVLGIVIGGLAGYYGGIIDNIAQRLIEVVRSIPHVPLWLALSAILPVDWSPLLIYFGITVILGLIDWTGLARAVRSKLLALREEDFCVAAQLMGASPRRIIFRHLLPSFTSHLIASATLAIPSMILGETALSFLGLGLRPPITSWGVLLNEAQNINVVALYPWLMLPVLPVIIVVLAFNFLGDGLRDAADPYK